MLFLDTCTVKADGTREIIYEGLSDGDNYNSSNTMNLTFDMETYQARWTINGNVVTGASNDHYDVEGGTLHISIPTFFILDVKDGVTISPTASYGVLFIPTNYTITGTASNYLHISNLGFYNADHQLIGMYNNNGNFQYTWYKGLQLFNGNEGITGDGRYGYNGSIEFDLSLTNVINIPTGGITCNLTFYYNNWIYSVKEQYQNIVGGQSVIDSASVEQLEDLNSTQEDTNTKITDFFGSFFDNLLHIFVPEDGYFSTWFDKVNTLLSDKLGMLYAPFDLVISTLQAIYSADSTESGIPFPGIKWEDTWLVEPFTFTFASLGSDFDDLRDKVYFATDTVLVLTFLMLLQSKVKLILEGHE